MTDVNLAPQNREGVIQGVLAKIPICFGLRHCHASAIVGNTVRQQVECSVELFRQQMEFSEAAAMRGILRESHAPSVELDFRWQISV